MRTLNATTSSTRKITAPRPGANSAYSFFVVGKSPAGSAIATCKAKELYESIEAGEDFAALAREFSEGAGRGDGGDIGWVNRGTLIAGLEEAALKNSPLGRSASRFAPPWECILSSWRRGRERLPLTAVGRRNQSRSAAKALEERFVKWLKTDLRRNIASISNSPAWSSARRI